MGRQQIHLGGPDRVLRPAQPRDEIDRQILPGRNGRRRDDAGILAGEAEDGRVAESDVGVVLAEQVSVSPMAGALDAVEQARFRQHQRARADGSENRAAGMHPLQPVDLALVATARRRVDRRVGVADDGDVGLSDVVDAGVRFDEHIAEAAERLAAGGHDLDVEQALLGLPGRHVGVDGADGQQHVIQAIEDGGRGFGRRKQRNRRSGLIRHDQSFLGANTVTFALFLCNPSLSSTA